MVHKRFLRLMVRGNFYQRRGYFRSPFRLTWIVEHHHIPELTQPGCYQRPPNELQTLQKYVTIENETEKDIGPLKVILLRDIEGIGNELDIIEIDRQTARNDLLITGKAAYASPFNLSYYDRVRQEKAEELASRQRIPYDILLTIRHLKQLVISVSVSIKNEWTLDTKHMLTALRFSGVEVGDESTIKLSSSLMTGPDMSLEGKLFRFYIVMDQQYVVPMLGRIGHIGSNQGGMEVLIPEQSKEPTENELANWGIKSEEFYAHKTPELTDKVDIFELMKSVNKLSRS